MRNITNELLKQPSLSFFDKRRGTVIPDICDEIRNGLWRDYNVDVALANEKIDATRVLDMSSEFADYIPLKDGVVWNSENNCFEEQKYVPHIVEGMNYDKFLALCDEYFAPYKDKKIAVHLSGGLDSSIIICILKELNIPFSLFGLVTDRFEFRTERRIQNILAEYGVETVFVNLEEYPHYGDLDGFPALQMPNDFIKCIAPSRKMVSEMKQCGVDVVFGGQGGDSLFVDSIPLGLDGVSFNIPNEFDVNVENEMHYVPNGMELKSFYADKRIIDAICTLRQGQRIDSSKWWARKFFKGILPRELSDYCYTADFFGLSMSGLEAAKPTIKTLFEEAHDLLEHPAFSPKATKEMLETDVFSFDYHSYCDFCCRISIAAWVTALFRM